MNPDHRAASLAFAAWLQQHGLKGFSQLTQPHDAAAQSTPRILGFGIKQAAHNDWQLVASCSIAAGQPILSLPLSLTLPLDDEQHNRNYSPLGPLLKHVPQPLWQLQLGLRLLSERTKQYSAAPGTAASFYQPYIDLLPLAYSTPLFYQRDDVQALQYPPVQQQINKRSRLLSTLSRAIAAQQQSGSADAFHGQDVSPSLLGWAMSAASSRAFSFHSHRRLLPLIDMANHSFTPSARIEATADSHPPAITMYATRDVEAGDALTLNYGAHSNDAFLVDYGFVLDDNPHDDLLLSFDLANVQLTLELIGESERDIRLDGWKRRLVDGMDRSDFRVTRDGLDRRLIALWLLHLTPMESSLALSLTSLSDTYFSIEQPTHSADAVRKIHRATSVFLSLVAGSWNRGGAGGGGQGIAAGGVGGMEEDLRELMEAAQTGREERTTAIRYRIAKKRLLREQLNRIERLMSNQTAP